MRHLLLVTVENPHDPKCWSGTPYNILRSLENKFDQVTVISSPVPKKSYFDSVLRLVLGRKKYPLWMTSTALKAYAKRLDEAIKKIGPDVILSISSQHLVYAKELNIPTFMISDAPWIAYKEAYINYEELPLLSYKYAKQEAEVAKRISGVIYPTPWACKEAESRFGIPANKVHLLPFGANRYCVETEEEVLSKIQKRTLDKLNFLFIGKDWERKGGPLALSIVRRINESGYPAALHIIGSNPNIDSDSLKYVHLYGYLAPESSEDCMVMKNAFSQADFFLVPSYAECFGLVFAEAQSYGLPCVSLNSQGIPGVVDNGKTGLLFSPDVTAESIAAEIIQLTQNQAAYLDMAVAARAKFRNDLNWDAFGGTIYQMLTKQ